ncbi:MAG: hypothetical protein U9P00_05505, partial [Pseudomonadota bacterium]|nr:hypothetical protein [Pseudomonadota bacterium]
MCCQFGKSYRKRLSEDIEEFIGEGFSRELWDENISKAYYTQGNLRDADSYRPLAVLRRFLSNDIPACLSFRPSSALRQLKHSKLCDGWRNA